MSKRILKTVFFLAAICSVNSAFAQFLLDDVMTRDDQKRTGVANLNPNQKAALEVWLNQNFVQKDAKANPQQTPDLSLSINIDGGEKIQLSDNSIWIIDPDDMAQSSTWITPFPVKIVPSNNTDYPFLIVNKNTGVSVRAKKGTSAPAAAPIQQ